MKPLQLDLRFRTLANVIGFSTPSRIEGRRTRAGMAGTGSRRIFCMPGHD